MRLPGGDEDHHPAFLKLMNKSGGRITKIKGKVDLLYGRKKKEQAVLKILEGKPILSSSLPALGKKRGGSTSEGKGRADAIHPHE